MKLTEPNFGGSLAGCLYISYADLVRALGEPNGLPDGYKTDAEWAIELDDGTKVSIYNYKDGKNYNGDEGDAVENITNWHLGSPRGGDANIVGKTAQEIRDLLEKETTA